MEKKWYKFAIQEIREKWSEILTAEVRTFFDKKYIPDLQNNLSKNILPTSCRSSEGPG